MWTAWLSAPSPLGPSYLSRFRTNSMETVPVSSRTPSDISGELQPTLKTYHRKKWKNGPRRPCKPHNPSQGERREKPPLSSDNVISKEPCCRWRVLLGNSNQRPDSG